MKIMPIQTMKPSVTRYFVVRTRSRKSASARAAIAFIPWPWPGVVPKCGAGASCSRRAVARERVEVRVFQRRRRLARAVTRRAIRDHAHLHAVAAPQRAAHEELLLHRGE